jgi:hypothetical protein
VDRLRERRPEHRDRGGEDHAGLIAAADRAHGVEEAPRAVEVDAVALVEIGLGLPRHDGGEVEDHVRPLGHELLSLPGLGEVRRHRADLEPRARRRLRLDHVVQGRPRDRPPAESAVPRQPLDELASDHAGRAEDEDVHFAVP